MSQWDPLPTTLTTFGPLSSEVQESSGFLSKFLKKTRDYNKDSSKSPNSSREVSVEREKAPPTVVSEKPTHNEGGSDEESGRSRASSGSEYSRQTSIIMQQMANRTRSGVLSRLSKILEGRDVTPQTYKDSDFKQYWMPDSSSRECYDCGDRFTTFRRRHHCRVCGQIFCSKCCNQELPGRIIGYKGGIRVCTYCGKVALSALQTEPTGNMHVDSDDLGNSTELEQSSHQIWGTKGRLSTDFGSSRGLMNRSITSQDSVADFCPEHIDAIDPKILVDSAQLRELWRKLLDPLSGVEMQSHRVKLSTYKNCISGNRVVDWLLKTDKVAQRLQAVAIGQALLDAGFLETIAGQPKVFHDDFTLYKPSEASPVDPPKTEMTDVESTEQSTEPEWFKSIQTDASLEEFSASEDFGESREMRKTKSSFITSQDSKSSGSRQESDNVDFEPLPRTDLDGLGGQDDLIAGSMFTSSQTITADKLTSMNRGWRHIESLKEENGERAAFIKLRDAYKDHLRDLASQMLTQEGLSKSWLDIILGTADRISRYVCPDVRVENDHMDIRKYIKFKKIPGGNKEQTCMIHGIVFTKNIAHKKMTCQITNPQILLMKGSIEYQRRVNKFSSLEPQILQEEEFLKNNISKIASLKPRPDIVVVENTVSRLAQTYLLQSGITLIFNVKMCVLERLARFTQACIVPSIDSIVSGPINLGFCHNFKVLKFSLPLGETKTMLCLDGCATHLGCTVILRGGTVSELKRLKKIMKWMVFVSYHSKLEISFCMDEFALPVNNSKANSLTSGMDDLSVSMEVYQPTASKTQEQTTPDEVASINDENADDEGLPITAIGIDKYSVGNGSQNMESFSSEMEVEIVVNIQDSESQDKTGKAVDEKEMKEMETEVSKEVVIIQEETPIIVSQQDRRDEIGLVVDNRTENCVNRLTENGSQKMCGKGSRQSSAKHPAGLEVSDQSDPLYNYQKNKDETIFFSSHTLQEKTLKHCQKYKKLLKEVILSCSPFISYELPYLETEEGSLCFNRKFFPEEIYLSCHLEPQTHQEMKKSKNVDYQPPVKKPVLMWSQVEVVEAHPLIVSQLSLPLTDKKMQEMLADFRARGGRLKLNYDNLPKGPVITYEAKGPKPTSQKAQNGALKPTEGESPKKAHTMVDCLDFAQHQRLVVLLSSYSEKSDNHPMPCLPPQLVTMEFYGSQDITLGGFLEKFCFRESYSCQPFTCTSATCDVPMLDHVRRIINSNGAIYISLRKLTNCVPGGERALMMWNWCRKCRQATPLVPMSMDSWNMSFAKYLELRFHATSFVRRVGADECNHSLHQFFSQYFGHRNIVATFKYYPITRREVVHPPPVITLEVGMQQSHWKRLKDEIRFLTTKCTDMFASIHTSIVNTNCEAHQETLNKLITDYKAIIPTEKSRIKDLADNTRQLLADIWVDIDGKSDPKDMKERLYLIQDDIVKIKRLLADAIQNWNHKLQELISQQKKYNKQAKKEASPPLPSEDDGKLSTSASSRHSGMEDSHSLTSTAEFTEIDASHVADLERRPTSGPVKIDPVEGNLKETFVNGFVFIDEDYALSTESNEYSVTPGIDADDGALEKSSEHADKDSVQTDVSNMLNSQDVEGTSNEDQLKPSKSKNNFRKVGSSDDILDGQKTDRITNIRSRVSNFLGGSNIPNALKVNYSEHHQLPVGKVPVLVYDEEPSSIIAYALGSHEYYTKLQEIQVSMTPRDTTQTKESKTSRGGDTDTGSTDSPESGRKHGSGVLSFLRGSSSRDSSPRRQRKAEYVDTVKYTPKVDQDSVEIDEQDGLSILTTSITSDTDRGRANRQIPLLHIQLQFSDSTAKFYCKIYFAEQFRQLRKLIFPQGEEMFIRSLSRCKLWEAKGGKSGSAFCKTHDNRFILKQMSSTEVEIFEKFGFEYFQYISKCYVEQRPTALAKIVGAFRIGFHNSQTNNDLKQDLLVIENLFYNRNISQTFDLKGSMRNRLVNTSRGQKSEQEVVLLDENLLKLSVDSPLYVYPHSKTVLNRAIEKDSEFLANNFVMDYSLLVGIDEGKKELVIGIIDYIRTFTWDKKLEMLLKSRGGLQPTVVSPDIYRTRFLDAMGRYFLPVPDQWSFLGREISY
ncbi:1-phosphatidylinositol 3-phosphate 5-kinase-like isoform X3 [Ostrea edulis]|uniref:1-phosphatidylinositol 3-phosphate 5-kinase-like isoform X3 n=1 Tax=Ostrea edulis TaxID=37623 RepID=UPI0024AFF1C4|nr:1-phosphatidylinositol 3-phosphate 5-kinase-like isoform X3 [Ostrea edulis]